MTAPYATHWPARPRPATVTVAFGLQCALAAALALTVVVAVADAIHFDGLIDQAARTPGTDAAEVDFERSANLTGALVPAVLAALLAGWLATTAIWLRRGSNVARVLTLVALCAPLLLGLLACLAGVLMAALLVPFLSTMPEEEPVPGDDEFADWETSAFADQLERLGSDGWSIALDVTGTTAAIAAFLLAVATGVLLLTGASNRYFGAPRADLGSPYPPYSPMPAYPHPAYYRYDAVPHYPWGWTAAPPPAPGPAPAAAPAPDR